jgi:Putative adhesin/Domain of unknown function (DUF5668)
MASPVQAPPNQMPPRPHHRFLSGPILLIAIGILFLLGTMGYLNWSRMGHWFAFYWPVILILAGVLKLIEYQTAQKQGVRAPGLGAGGVFLVILLIIFGIVSTHVARFHWEQLRNQIDIDDNDFNWFGEKYSYEDQLAQEFPAGASLRVVDTRGAVNVSTSTDKQIHVSVHKRVTADNQANADKYNSATKPQITVSGNLVTLNANNSGAGDHNVAEDLDIALPRNAPVSISTHSGDVSVLGRDGDVQISAHHNEVSASDINGKVSLNLDHSAARVSQVSSDVSIEGRANDVSLEDIKGAVHLDGEFMESVKLAKIGEGVVFKSSRTDMQLGRLDGDLDLDSGDLQASGVTGPVRLTTRAKDIRLTGISGDVRLQDEDGSVELRVKKLGSMQVENRKGDIQLYVPDKASFQVDARATGGEIETDFSSVKIDDSQTTATGTVGNGGPRLVLNDEHGTIEIRKASSSDSDDEESEAPGAPKPPRAPSPPHAPSTPRVTEN